MGHHNALDDAEIETVKELFAIAKSDSDQTVRETRSAHSAAQHPPFLTVAPLFAERTFSLYSTKSPVNPPKTTYLTDNKKDTNEQTVSPNSLK
jgi:hypothetical protein